MNYNPFLADVHDNPSLSSTSLCAHALVYWVAWGPPSAQSHWKTTRAFPLIAVLTAI
jgi:hypothetical protein